MTALKRRLLPVAGTRLCLALLLVAGPLATGAPAESASTLRMVETLDRRMPRARYVGGGFSFVFGGMGVARGVDILQAREGRSAEERGLAAGLTFVSALRVIDGTHRLLFADSLETRLKRNPRMSAADLGFALRRSARSARGMRWLRNGLRLTAAALYFRLYQIQPERNGGLIYPAAALVGVTLFRSFIPSPEEQAWRDFSVSFTVAPGPAPAGPPGLQLAWRW